MLILSPSLRSYSPPYHDDLIHSANYYRWEECPEAGPHMGGQAGPGMRTGETPRGTSLLLTESSPGIS